jgi:hypothetical protein
MIHQLGVAYNRGSACATRQRPTVRRPGRPASSDVAICEGEDGENFPVEFCLASRGATRQCSAGAQTTSVSSMRIGRIRRAPGARVSRAQPRAWFRRATRPFYPRTTRSATLASLRGRGTLGFHAVETRESGGFEFRVCKQ